MIAKLTKDKTKGPTSRCQEKANAHGGSVLSVYKHVFPGCVMELNKNQVDKMKLDADFELVEEDGMAYATDCTVEGNTCIVSDPTWGLNRVDQCHLPLSTANPFEKLPANDVKVYILDTGIRGTHQEFIGMIGDENDPNSCHWTAYSGSALSDGDGHGTHVAGTVVGNTYGKSLKVLIVLSLCSNTHNTSLSRCFLL